MDIQAMSETTSYYDNNANSYFDATVNVDFSDSYNHFTTLLPEHARIIDMGCGSGRDVKAFCDMGFDAVGLDASDELASVAEEKLGIKVIRGDMSTWITDTPFDGIWCCASLLHLRDEEIQSFFDKLTNNLKPGGVIFISVKEGSGRFIDDKGRYMKLFTEKELEDLLTEEGINTIEHWKTSDTLGRNDVSWLNYIGRK